MGLTGKLSVFLLIAIIFFLPTRAYAGTATVSDISKQLICQCGCNMVLLNCSHAECHSREAMTAFINQEIIRGQSEEQIIASFVAQYGEQVLAEPPKRGFNLVAWVTPFAAILAGGGIIYLVLRVWVRRGRRSQAVTVTRHEEEDEVYQHQLEKELQEFTERGFR